MRTFLDMFLALPMHLRFYIWTLLMETHALDVAQHYRIMSTHGSTIDVTIPIYSPQPSHALVARVERSCCHQNIAVDLSLVL